MENKMKKLIAVLTLLILSTSSFAQLDQFTKFALEQAEVKESVSISAKPYTFTNGYFKGETADRKIVQYRLFIPLYSKGGRSMYDEKEDRKSVV